MRITTVLAVAFLGATCLADSSHAQAAIKHYRLDIPRQPLDTALNDLAQQTGLQIGRFSERVDGSAVVGPVRGEQTPEEALKILLSRTGLAYKIVSDTTIAVYNPKATTSSSVNTDAGADSSSDPKEGDESRSFRDRFRLAQGGAPAVTAVGKSSPEASTESGPAAPVASHDPAELSEVVVTGTLIASQDAISAHPLSIISSETLQATNTVTLDDILNKAPEVTHQGYGPTTAQGQQTGTTAVDLRNLGTNRTLVLMNGIRYTPTATIANVAVNLATIPVSLIDHIEVLRDGASPIYGADAVAGVINIITKRNFTGFEGDADASVSGHGDRPTGHISLTAGHDFEGGNIVANVDSSYRAGLTADHRDFSKFQIQRFLVNGDGTFTAAYGKRPSPGGTATIGGQPVMFTGPGLTVPLDPQQLFVDEETAGLISRTQITTGTVQGHYDFAHDIEAYMEGSYSHEYTFSYGGPLSFSPNRSPKYLDAGTVPADNPYNTFGVPVPLYRQYDEIGVRNVPTTLNTWRLLGGLRGEFANGWKWDAHYAYGASDTDSTPNNNINVPHLINAFDPVLCAAAPGCVVANPFGPGNISAAAADYIRYKDEFKNHYLQQLAGISLSGTALTLPAGPLGFAIGAERRREGGGTNFDPLALSGDSSLTGATNTLGSYSLTEGFAEVNIPVLRGVPVIKSLTVDPAVRYSDYNTFGSHSTWKVGIDWATGDDLRVRASKGTAFRAPDIHELFGGALNTFAYYSDPCDPANGKRSNPRVDAACLSQGLNPTFQQFSSQVSGTFEGNPRLHPETANEENIGVVLTPHWLPGLTATVDYYRINLTNAVFQPLPDLTLENCYVNFGPGNPDCARFTRGTDGQINDILLQLTNVGTIKTSGVDFSVADAFNVGPGRLSAGLQGAYLISFLQQTEPDEAPAQYAGTFGAGPYTKLRMNADFGYAWGDWSFRYEVRYIKGSTSIVDDRTTAPAFYLRTPDVYYNDVSASFRRGPLMLVAGIENLGNKQPPDQGRFINDTDTLTYDLIGRNFFLKAALRY